MDREDKEYIREKICQYHQKQNKNKLKRMAGRTLRSMIIKRDNYTCRYCGYSTEKEKMPMACNFCGKQNAMRQEESADELIDNA
jgi:rubrerythrin